MGDVVERSDALDKRIAGSDEVQALVKYGHRNRMLIRWVIVSVTFDILLSVALGVVAFRAQQTAEQAQSNQARLYQACLAGNDFRRTQLSLWHYILDLPPEVPRTEAQQHQADQFRVYVDQQFALRRC